MGVGYKSKSVFGGILALLAWALLIMEVTQAMNRIYWQKENEYTKNEIFLSPMELEDLTVKLGDLKNSAKFAFGLNVGTVEATGFDMLNNPYVEFKGLEMQYWNDKTTLFDLEVCPEDFVASFIEAHIRPIYS